MSTHAGSTSSHSTATRNANPVHARANGRQRVDRGVATGDALEMLIDDHHDVEKLFLAFERAPQHDFDRKTALVQRACEELLLHAMIEEDVFYPAAKKALANDDRAEVNEALVEHFLVKSLIEKFSTLSADQEGFDATMKVLMENVRHHVNEEENTLFPAVRKTSLDLDALATRLGSRREALRAQAAKAVGAPVVW